MKITFRSVRHLFFFLLNLLVAVCLLLADMSVFIDPTKHTWIALFGLLFEGLMWLNVVFALLWLLTHGKKYALMSGLLLVFSLPNIARTYSHQSASEDKHCEHSLTVLTYNTHMMGMVKKAADNDVLQYVKQSGADVVCLQEFDVRKDRHFLTLDETKGFLKDEYPYTYFDFATFSSKRQYGIAVFSRYPLIGKQSIRYESRANNSNYCDVVMGKDTVRLFNNHLESNRFEQDELNLAEEEMTSEGVKKSVLQVVRRMRPAYEHRAEQVNMVKESVVASPYPVIVVGDMNDVPVSYTYRTLSKGLTDAFLASSWCKRGHSFTTHLLGVRIDYILVDKRFKVAECALGDVDYSDHQPLMARLMW